LLGVQWFYGIMIPVGDSMYNIAKDSLFQPKMLLKYRNKSGFFTFLYLLVLALFLSIGAIVYYAGYKTNSVLTEETTGCQLVAGEIVCSGAGYDPLTRYNLYDYSVFFLNADDNIAILNAELSGQVMVFQENTVHFYVSGVHLSALQMIPDDSQMTFTEFFKTLQTGMIITVLIVNYIGNLILLLFISLISTLPFLRLKKFIPYKKIYRLVVFSITPLAFLLTFYYLIDLPELLFFLLMFLGYRSVFILQRELTFQTLSHLQNLSDNVMDGDYKVVDDEQSDKEENREEESEDDESDDGGLSN